MKYPPEYVPYNDCWCDERNGLCDIGCCCDGDCQLAVRRNSFLCTETDIEERSGGPVLSNTQPCQLPVILHREEEFLFLCHHSGYNAHLGSFYPDTPIARTLLDTSQQESRRKPNIPPVKKEDLIDVGTGDGSPNALDQEYYRTFRLQPEVPLIPAQRYVFGTPVTLSDHNAFLGLPAPTLAGPSTCATRSPVRFLEEFEHTCVTEILESVCLSRGDLFNVSSYLLPLDSDAAEDDSNLRILKDPMDHKSVLDSIRVKYKCIGTADKEDKEELETLIDPNEEYVFPSEEKFQRKPETETTVIPNCKISNVLTKVPGFPAMIQNQASGRRYCQNAVTSVEYTIRWTTRDNDTRSMIMAIDAEITLDDLLLDDTSSPTIIQQRFSVKWAEFFTRAENQARQNSLPKLSLPLSGNPGYDHGKPIIVGEANEDGTLIANPDNQYYLLQTDTSNLCNRSKPTPVLFGANSDASCYLQFRRESFSDENACYEMKQAVIRGLSSQFYSALISPTGFIRPVQSSTDFIEVIRQNLTDLFDFQPPSSTNSKESNNNEVLEGSGEAEEESLQYNNINVSTPLTQLKTTTPQPKSTKSSWQSSGGPRWLVQCRNVPYHIGLDIFYAEVERADNGRTPIHEITGAYTYFNFTNWLYSDPLRSTQRFLVSTNVRFIRTPPSEPSKYIAEFWIRDSDGTDDERGPFSWGHKKRPRRDRCPGSPSVCWSDLLYPFKDKAAFRDIDEYSYQLAMTLLTIFFAIVVYWLTKPWGR